MPVSELLRAGHPLLAVLGYSGRYASVERRSDVRIATIAVFWNQAEPSRGNFDDGYVASLDAEIRVAVARHLGVVIDPGIQYPPSWVFGLGGGTRFVDQYGDRFTGTPGSGDDVANPVTDLAVRRQLQTYLRWLGQRLPLRDVLAVRQGGGPLGELRYPDADYNGRTNCYWAYDVSSRVRYRALAYRPGSGTPGEARAFLARYDANLDDFADWMNAQFRVDFHRATLLLLPGWGQRPGVAAVEAAHLLTVPYDEFSQGLDWGPLLASLPDRADSVAYTTYLDAPSFGASPVAEDPADYLSTLARHYGIALGGENTGSVTGSSLGVTFRRASALHLRIVGWFDEQHLVAASRHRGPGPTFTDLGDAARADLDA